MNFEQILKRAESGNTTLNDINCTKIYIASSPDNPSALELQNIFTAAVNKAGMKADVVRTGSFGYYDLEPLVLAEKSGGPAYLYNNATSQAAPDIVNDYLVNDNPRPEMIFCSFGNTKTGGIQQASGLPLFSMQKRIALRNCGLVNPGSISHYILRANGYSGLFKALQKDKSAVIEEITKAGLRGRGGAGYPTADKWKACAEAAGEEKYVICNCLDADPKCRTARLLLESDPHSVLEGMLIAAYAAGACHCIVYVNETYTHAITLLEKALDRMKAYGFTGNNILGSKFSCEITINKTKPSLVRGQETAILRIMQDRQAMPYMRPPYPAVNGLAGNPTLINNAETLSNVSAIFQNGMDSFSGTGTDNSRGSKIITLSGKYFHEYTLEVPFGTTFGSIFEATGLPYGKDFRAFQFGGPTGAYFTSDGLDMQIDYEAIREAGSIIGSGTLEVFDGNFCAVDIARNTMSYLHSESCGKCVFCREGTYQISDILADIFNNAGKPGDIDLINEIGGLMPDNCICGLGRTAAIPAMSSIKLFRSEYDAHIKEKRCVKN